MRSRIDLEIEKYIQEVINDLHDSKLDPNIVMLSKEWYKKFTGAEYPEKNNLKELVEMYTTINKTT
jgi:hypothetical protein